MSQLTIQRKNQWQHALKFKPGPNHASSQTDLQLQDRFGVATVKGQAGAVSIKKPFIKFGDPEYLTDEMERLIMQNKEFRAFGQRCNWQGNEYFQNYKGIRMSWIKVPSTLIQDILMPSLLMDLIGS